MSEEIRTFEVAVENRMEYIKCSGDPASVRMILRPHCEPKSAAKERIERDELAKLTAERLRPVASTFAPLPENLAF